MNGYCVQNEESEDVKEKDVIKECNNDVEDVNGNEENGSESSFKDAVWANAVNQDVLMREGNSVDVDKEACITRQRSGEEMVSLATSMMWQRLLEEDPGGTEEQFVVLGMRCKT